VPKAVGKIPEDKASALTLQFSELIRGSITGAGMRRLLVPDETCCSRVAAIKDAIHAAGGEPSGFAIGNAISRGLSAVGITEERVSALVGPCGCDERKSLLNRAGWAVQHAIGAGVGDG
jgi:hypothetical protein